MLARKLLTAVVAGSAILAAATVTTTPASATPATGQDLDRRALRETLAEVPKGGVYGIYSAVQHRRQSWRGAAGQADVSTGRPTRPDMRHRVGSITKTFTATAVMRLVERGRIGLDTPVETYLPGLLPDARVTVRMLLNHTSHIGDYDEALITKPEDLDALRVRQFTKRELITLGLGVGKTGEPGQVPGVYSNTNYIVLALLITKVTGEEAEEHITRSVIRAAGLEDTSFPRTPYLPRPHARAYTSAFGYYDPPRDYTVFNMSWASTAGGIVSTMSDLNRFYRALLGGKLVSPSSLAQMKQTVPVLPGEGAPAATDYGLGIFTLDLPCGGKAWGHDGGVIGMATNSLTTENLDRQVSTGVNLTWHPPAEPGEAAHVRHILTALCGAAQPAARSAFTLPNLDALPSRS
ncbi:serine hydrolase domain-containing protein [Nonomuraea sp. NPDC050790]|uniref:serine hydrolase domain-containing protein n=1 Tax=Nonomuraea sp. NPDC050790 TaxID=3364371 RepID=UPI003798F31C